MPKMCLLCKFLPCKDICKMFESLSEIENSLQEDTKMTLTYIVGYIFRKDENSDDTFFYYEKYGRFLKTIN